MKLKQLLETFGNWDGIQLLESESEGFIGFYENKEQLLKSDSFKTLKERNIETFYIDVEHDFRDVELTIKLK